MKIRWSHLLLPIGGAVVAGVFVPVAFWDGAKMPMMTALSVIAAGVLVRLARGLPFNNVDQLLVEEARAISSAVRQSARGLKALVVVVFVCMGQMMFASPLAAGMGQLLALWPSIAALAEPSAVALEVASPLVSAAIGGVLTYVLVRVYSVINGDVGLVELQTKYLVSAVERKQAERFEKAVESSGEGAKMKNPVGYGKVIQ